jgi:IS30 family transposase
MCKRYHHLTKDQRHQISTLLDRGDSVKTISQITAIPAVAPKIQKVVRLDKVSEEKIEAIEKLLNNRPRKILDYQTPLEVFNKLRAEGYSSS